MCRGWCRTKMKQWKGVSTRSQRTGWVNEQGTLLTSLAYRCPNNLTSFPWCHWSPLRMRSKQKIYFGQSVNGLFLRMLSKRWRHTAPSSKQIRIDVDITAQPIKGKRTLDFCCLHNKHCLLTFCTKIILLCLTLLFNGCVRLASLSRPRCVTGFFSRTNVCR